MRRSRNFCQDGPGPTARKQLFFFCPQLLQFYSGLSMVYLKKTIILQGFGGGGGGGPTYSEGGAGAGGPNANSINP